MWQFLWFVFLIEQSTLSQILLKCNMLYQIAKEEEKGVYLNFLNFLINDSIFLLDESLNKILEHKELEAEMSNTAEWERRPAQERQERTRLFHSQENVSVPFPPLHVHG